MKEHPLWIVSVPFWAMQYTNGRHYPPGEENGANRQGRKRSTGFLRGSGQRMYYT